MGPNYIALAIPFFFVLIGVELVVARRRGARPYRLADALANLGCGVTQRILLLAFEGLLVAIYVAVYRHARLVDLGAHPVIAWVTALVGVDFIYYWWHRASHRVSFLWAAHVVHHQSEDYNLAVALRQAVLTPVTALPFGLPLALLGVPPLVYLAANAFSTLYQFWIHTEMVGKLGAAETVLNTPSHHRVHHARNPGYLDRNYGAALIVWDRLFGTFAPERERPVYGINKPLGSFNALWAQVEPLGELVALSRAAPSWRERLRVWLAPPERSFPWQPSPPPPPLDAPKHRLPSPPSARLRRYVLANFAAAAVATFLLLLWSNRLAAWQLVAGGALVLATVAATGGLLEARPWARRLEVARLASIVAASILAVVA